MPVAGILYIVYSIFLIYNYKNLPIMQFNKTDEILSMKLCYGSVIAWLVFGLLPVKILAFGRVYVPREI